MILEFQFPEDIPKPVDLALLDQMLAIVNEILAGPIDVALKKPSAETVSPDEYSSPKLSRSVFLVKPDLPP